jgi:hypothetical protein
VGEEHEWELQGATRHELLLVGSKIKTDVR